MPESGTEAERNQIDQDPITLHAYEVSEEVPERSMYTCEVEGPCTEHERLLESRDSRAIEARSFDSGEYAFAQEGYVVKQCALFHEYSRRSGRPDETPRPTLSRRHSLVRMRLRVAATRSLRR